MLLLLSARTTTTAVAAATAFLCFGVILGILGARVVTAQDEGRRLLGVVELCLLSVLVPMGAWFLELTRQLFP